MTLPTELRVEVLFKLFMECILEEYMNWEI